MHALTILAVTLKIATLAPEGSAWMNLFHKWQAKVEQRSEGRIKVKFYSGGVMGDEKDVIRKMKAGQLSGAAITGIGLAMINPEVRALEAARTSGLIIARPMPVMAAPESWPAFILRMTSFSSPITPPE